jgi:hypothetical protein
MFGDRLRCWSLLREPPLLGGEHRLAIERESYAPDAIEARCFDEQAFGKGFVRTWDHGTVEVSDTSPKRIGLLFSGSRLAGPYELRRMRWYPGNRWLLEKLPPPEPSRE